MEKIRQLEKQWTAQTKNGKLTIEQREPL